MGNRKRKGKGLKIALAGGLFLIVIAISAVAGVVEGVASFAAKILEFFSFEKQLDTELIQIMSDHENVFMPVIEALPYDNGIINLVIRNKVTVGKDEVSTIYFSSDREEHEVDTKYHERSLVKPDDCNDFTEYKSTIRVPVPGRVEIGAGGVMRPVMEDKDVTIYVCNGHPVYEYGHWNACGYFSYSDALYDYGLPWQLVLAAATTKYYTTDILSDEELEKAAEKMDGSGNSTEYKLKKSAVESYMRILNPSFEFVYDYTYDVSAGVDVEKLFSFSPSMIDYYLENEGLVIPYYLDDRGLARPVMLVSRINTYLYDYYFDYAQGKDGNYYTVSARRESRYQRFLAELSLCDVTSDNFDLFMIILENMPGSADIVEEIEKAADYYNSTGCEMTETLSEGIAYIVPVDENRITWEKEKE